MKQIGDAVGGAARGGAVEGVGKGTSAMTALPLAGLAQGLGGVGSEGLKRLFFGRELGERKDPMSLMGTQAASGLGAGFGKEMGSMGAKLLADMASKAMSAMGSMGDSSARDAIIKQLKREDPILAEADDKTLMEAYHTMTRFAPVLSTDKNAVRSFLRQAVMNGAGPDYASIKLLADSERAVTGKKE